MNEDEKFYKERSWELLVNEIKSLKEDLLKGLENVRQEVRDMKSGDIDGLQQRINKLEVRIYWLLGIVSVIIFIIQNFAGPVINKYF